VAARGVKVLRAEGFDSREANRAMDCFTRFLKMEPSKSRASLIPLNPTDCAHFTSHRPATRPKGSSLSRKVRTSELRDFDRTLAFHKTSSIKSCLYFKTCAILHRNTFFVNEYCSGSPANSRIGDARQFLTHFGRSITIKQSSKLLSKVVFSVLPIVYVQ
jgi:hypothetical protein